MAGFTQKKDAGIGTVPGTPKVHPWKIRSIDEHAASKLTKESPLDDKLGNQVSDQEKVAPMFNRRRQHEMS
jgi:hypothetical protein